jgi:hypothetical protein
MIKGEYMQVTIEIAADIFEDTLHWGQLIILIPILIYEQRAKMEVFQRVRCSSLRIYWKMDPWRDVEE